MDENVKDSLKKLGIDYDEWREKYLVKEKAFWKFVDEQNLSTAELGQIGCSAAVTGALEAGMTKEEFLSLVGKQYDGTVDKLGKFQEVLKDKLKDVMDKFDVKDLSSSKVQN